MGQTTQTFIDQRLSARITKASIATMWYANKIGQKFEVERTPIGLRVVESEAQKLRAERRIANKDTVFYISEDDCRVVRI